MTHDHELPDVDDIITSAELEQTVAAIAAVQLPDESLVVPGTKRQWVLYGAAGLGGLIVLLLIFRALGAANRPR